MKKYVLALDEGTTSTRAILFDKDSRVVSMAQHEIAQIYPEPGWVEQDPMDIYANQYASLTECIAKSGISPDEIAAVGITNQRETVILWEKIQADPYITLSYGNADEPPIFASGSRSADTAILFRRPRDSGSTLISAEPR